VSIGPNVFGILSTNAAVIAIAGGPPTAGIFPGVLPQGRTAPAVVYNVITGMPENVMDAPAVADHEIVQLDAWALDYNTATALREAVRAAFEDQPVLIARGIGAKIIAFYPDAYEPDTKRYSRSIGLSMWTGR